MRVQSEVRFSMPSDASRDAGIFLVFLGAVASIPLYYLFRVFAMNSAEWDWRKGAALGAIVVACGLYLMLFTRKTFRVYPDAIIMKDGLLKPAARYTWTAEPRIRLRSLEMERGGKAVEMWQVNLVDGRYEYALDRRAGQQMESRSLAELLAKSIGCPVVERLGEEDLELPAEELDLPFCERVRLHPGLLGPELEEPPGSRIERERSGEGWTFRWSLMSPAQVSEIVVVYLVVLAVGLLPLPAGGEEGRDYSLLDLAGLAGDYTYFLVSGGIFAFAMLLLVGYRASLRIGPEGVTTRARLWGMPLRSRSIPARYLEEVSVRQTSRGSFLQLVSDQRILSLRLSNPEQTAWVASQVRHYFARQEMCPD